MIKALLLTLATFIHLALAAQVDSLMECADKAKHDTTRLRNIVLASEVCEISDIPIYADQAIELAEYLESKPDLDQDKILLYKATAYNNLGFLHHARSQFDAALAMYDKSKQIFENIADTIGISRSYNNIAMVRKDRGDIKIALEMLMKSTQLCEGRNDEKLLHINYSNIATIYTHLAQVDSALHYIYKSLKIQERIGDKFGMGYSYNTLSSLYHTQRDYKSALEASKKAMAIREEIKDYEGLASSYNNIGFIHDMNDNDSLALVYYMKGLEIRETHGLSSGTSDIYSNLSSYYLDRGDTLTGLKYLQDAIKIREDVGDIEGISNTYIKYARVLHARKQADLSLKYARKAYKIAMNTGYVEDIMNASQILAKVYYRLGKADSAYLLHVQHLNYRDSLTNDENQREIVRQEIDYDYAKKRLADSVEHAKTLEIQKLENKHREEKLDKVQKLNAAMIVGLVLLLGVILFAIRAYRNKKNFALSLAHQKEIVEEKNREVTASINYAKRIQTAILPPESLMEKHFKDYFLIYKPKDIVAGDFYWMEVLPGSPPLEELEEVGNTILFAVADCTGHGVPGAMVSVICANALNKGVIEENITNPAELLDRTREHVLESFRRSNEDIKDGMDIALCSLTFAQREKQSVSDSLDSIQMDAQVRSASADATGDTQTVSDHSVLLNYAGANNPLWIVSKKPQIDVNGAMLDPILSQNDSNLFEIKADKQPIGLYGKEQAFSNHRMELNEGDQLYLFSDGFADQFGGKGEKAKKFKASNFKRLILETSNMSAKDQGQSLELALNEWMGDYEQLDDICVIGVRI